MAVTAKTYTLQQVAGMSVDEKRTAAPEVLKTFNESGQSDMKAFQVYREIMLALDVATDTLGSQSKYRETFAERHINDNPYRILKLA